MVIPQPQTLTLTHMHASGVCLIVFMAVITRNKWFTFNSSLKYEHYILYVQYCGRKWNTWTVFAATRLTLLGVSHHRFAQISYPRLLPSPEWLPFITSVPLEETERPLSLICTGCCLLRYRCPALWNRVYLQPINTNMRHAFQVHGIWSLDGNKHKGFSDVTLNLGNKVTTAADRWLALCTCIMTLWQK